MDTGVWVSALISPTGAPAQIAVAATTDRIEVIVSPRLLNELTIVLSREKFRRWFNAKNERAFVTELSHRAWLYPDVENPPEVTRDCDDDYLVALALAHDAILVSVDKDLLEADLDPPALTPRELLLILN
ncbi:MAG: putative toxin-antitoxin system toxin component, PIN family [Candidatus Dormibacteraceae bacterium]